MTHSPTQNDIPENETLSSSQDASLSLAGAKSAAESDDLEQINPVLLGAMLAAIREKRESESLSDEALIAICCEAIRQGTISNQQWLRNRLNETRQKLGLAPVPEDESAPDENASAPSVPAPRPEQQEAAAGAVPATEEAPPAKPAFTEIPVATVRKISTREELDEVLQAHKEWIEITLDPNKTTSGGRANLTESVLSDMDLSFIDLRGATLSKVNFSGSDLKGCNFSTANLIGANFTGCNLEGANLRRCQLAGADFTGANLKDTILRTMDLKGAIYQVEQLVEAKMV
jgi:hypothetical protein